MPQGGLPAGPGPPGRYDPVPAGSTCWHSNVWKACSMFWRTDSAATCVTLSPTARYSRVRGGPSSRTQRSCLWMPMKIGAREGCCLRPAQFRRYFDYLRFLLDALTPHFGSVGQPSRHVVPPISSIGGSLVGTPPPSAAVTRSSRMRTAGIGHRNRLKLARHIRTNNSLLPPSEVTPARLLKATSHLQHTRQSRQGHCHAVGTDVLRRSSFESRSEETRGFITPRTDA